MDDWFPRVESQPITVKSAIGADGSYTNSSFKWTIQYGKPFQTFTKTKSKSHIVLINGSERYLNQSEMSAGASFPIDYKFLSYENAVERIGNSVPPLFMYSIARNIKSMLQTGKPYRQEIRTGKIDYPAHLAAMWELAIAPREPNAPTVISTFAGGGGSSTGYLMAGYRELLAVEWDDNAVQTLRLNYPHLDIYHGDIAKLTVEDVLQRTGLQPGQLDVLDGSPPCQGFSTAGKRDFDDDRNQLFREYVRLLRGLRPKVFVMENVSGMVKGKMKLIFAEILRELKASGYKVSARLLNAMYFHVPQSRERMIFIGVRDDLGIEPSHPKAESQPITVGMAFSGLGDDITERVNPKSDSLTLSQMSKVAPGQRCKLHHSHHRLTTEKSSPTVDRGGGAGEWHIWHPVDTRPITRKEVKRLGSFPDAYRLAGSISDAFVRIGNSVPPLFMEAVARHIRLEILSRCNQLVAE